MSMFLSKALRRAEVFLEQVDESVAQASRRLVVEGAVGDVDVDDSDEDLDDTDAADDRASQASRASAIPKAQPAPPASQHAPQRLDAPADPPTAADELSDADAPVPAAADVSQPPPEQPEQSASPAEPRDEARVPAAPAASDEPGSADTAVRAEAPADDATGPADTPPQAASQSAATVAESGSQFSVASSAALTALSPSDANIALPASVPEPTASASAAGSAATKPASAPAAPVGPANSASGAGAGAAAAPDEYVAALNEENAALRQELEQLEDAFEKGRRERSKLVKNLKRMKEIVAEMDESLQEKSAEARTAQDELEKLRDEVNSLRKASVEDSARGKDSLDLLRKQLTAEVDGLKTAAAAATREAAGLRTENERLRQAMLQGREVDLATADGARQDASQAHRAYEAETVAHRETRRLAKEREEALQEEAAVATVALATAQRKAEEAVVAMNTARAMQRAADGKVGAVTSARDAAFARIEDLEAALRLYDGGEGREAPGQAEAKAMRQTVGELEHALEAKNVELTRLEGEVESLRAALKQRRDGTSPRAGAAAAGRSDSGSLGDVEVRLRHMADSALRKQAQLEVLRSENRALQQQLGTERKRTREAQAMAAAASSSRQSIRGGFRGLLDPGESERGDRLYGVRDGPLARFRAPRSWPRAVATVLTGLDRMSAHALALLRKEPVLRLVVVMYVALLHVFTYSVLHWHVDAVAGGRVGARAAVGGAAGLAAKAVGSAANAGTK